MARSRRTRDTGDRARDAALEHLETLDRRLEEVQRKAEAKMEESAAMLRSLGARLEERRAEIDARVRRSREVATEKWQETRRKLEEEIAAQLASIDELGGLPLADDAARER